MRFKIFKIANYITIIFFLLIITNEKEVNNNKINSFFLIQFEEKTNLNSNLRDLWDNSVKCGEACNSRDKEEKDSLKHCKRSAYKYFIHYVAGQNYTFQQFINRDNAVRFK